MKYFNDQNYHSIKKKCKSAKQPFCDSTFPAENCSLGTSKHLRELSGKVQWKRPKDIVEHPKLCVKGTNSTDVVQGRLGNCWFVAACSALVNESELFNKVIPDIKEQEWNDKNPKSYEGVFHFRFWRSGEWLDVVIDDRLPTISGKLVYLHSRQNNEFWGPLLEKAYAKVHGTYEALEGGNLSDALVDFTGGVAESIDIGHETFRRNKDERQNLFKLMNKLNKQSLMCCAIKAETRQEIEQITEVGLVKGHAYGITAVKKVNIGSTSLRTLFTGREKINMIRMRNPWGVNKWNGPFSTGSLQWKQISKNERERVGLIFDRDGEFWMSFDDFCRYFTELSICYMVNTYRSCLKKSWFETSFHGQWTTGAKGSRKDRAGGCINHRNTFLNNPQYLFEIKSEKEEVLLHLIQEDTRAKKLEGKQSLAIGFHVMKVANNSRYRLQAIHDSPAATSDYIKSRSIFQRSILNKGRYCLIPATFTPGYTGHFYLRIYTNKRSNAKELTKDGPQRSNWPCKTYPCLLSYVTIFGTIGIENPSKYGSLNLYCKVKCERESLTGGLQSDVESEWTFSALFYRKKATSQIVIQIWNKNIIKDDFIGQAILNAPTSSEPKFQTVELFGRWKEKDVKRPGKVLIRLATSDVS